MLDSLMVGAVLVAVTVTIHAVGSTFWVGAVAIRYLREDGSWGGGRMFGALLGTVVFLSSLHVLQVTLWAITYRMVVPESVETFEKAFYFSVVTFTTLGYGDVTLDETWRVLSGIEAMSGIVLVGWTTALMFVVVQRSWSGLDLAAKIQSRKQTNHGE